MSDSKDCKKAFWSLGLPFRVGIIFLITASHFDLPCQARNGPVVITTSHESVTQDFIFGTGGKWKYKWAGEEHWKINCPWFVWTISAEDKREYNWIVNYLRTHGTECIGYYYSAVTAIPSSWEKQQYNYPERGFPRVVCERSWFIRRGNSFASYGNNRERYFLDIANKAVQTAVLERAISNARKLGCDALCLDNIVYKKFVPYPYDKKIWSEGMFEFVKLAKSYTDKANLRLVINIADDPNDWLDLSPFVDGFSYERASRPELFSSKTSLESCLVPYDKILSEGKSLFFWTGRTGYGTPEHYDADGRRLAMVALMVIPMNQRHWGGVFMTVTKVETWPHGGWFFWFQQLGKPLGQRQWKGSEVTRKFENGSVCIKVGDNPKFNISLEY